MSATYYLLLFIMNQQRCDLSRVAIELDSYYSWAPERTRYWREPENIHTLMTALASTGNGLGDDDVLVHVEPLELICTTRSPIVALTRGAKSTEVKE